MVNKTKIPTPRARSQTPNGPHNEVCVWYVKRWKEPWGKGKVEQGQGEKLLAVLNRVARLTLTEDWGLSKGGGKDVRQAGPWVRVLWAEIS